jgi:hypothetical protein
LLGLAAAAWSAAAAADDAGISGPALGPVAQSAGKRGSTLNWLPYRPQSGDAPAKGRTASGDRVARATPAAAFKTVQQDSDSPMANPFGETSTDPVSTTETASAQGETVEPSRAAAKPKELPPRLYMPRLARVSFGADDTGESKAATNGQPGTSTSQESNGQAKEEDLRPKCPEKGDPTYFGPLKRDVTNIRPKLVKGVSTTPVLVSEKEVEDLMGECPLTSEPPDRPLNGPRINAHNLPWAPTTFAWKASGVCHKPLYFEDVQLERYGHSAGPLLQPLASAAHFFVLVPALPYSMGLEPPAECIYTLGYYRPGSCAPYMLDPIPFSVRAGLAQAGVVTGLVYIIP